MEEISNIQQGMMNIEGKHFYRRPARGTFSITKSCWT